MKRIATSLLFAAFAAACGPAPAPGGAALALRVTADEASQRRMAAYAAEVTDPEAVLEEYRPGRLQVLVCDRIELTAQVTNFCTAEAEDYNALRVVDIEGNTGSITIDEIPPGKDQVIVVQGLSAQSNLLTYQGVVSAPAIEPRGTYEFDVALAQVRYPPLTAAAPPELTTASPSEVTHTTSTFTITGTRELETLMRVTLDGAFRIGSPKTFTGDEGGFYVERVKNDRIEWELTLTIPAPRTATKTYKISFQAARTFDESNFSKETGFFLKACGSNDAGTCPAP